MKIRRRACDGYTDDTEVVPPNCVLSIMELRGEGRSQVQLGNEGSIGHPELVEGSDALEMIDKSES